MKDRLNNLKKESDDEEFCIFCNFVVPKGESFCPKCWWTTDKKQSQQVRKPSQPATFCGCSSLIDN